MARCEPARRRPPGPPSTGRAGARGRRRRSAPADGARIRTRSRRRSCRPRRASAQSSSGIARLAGLDDRSVGRHDGGPDEVVAAQPGRAHQEADPAGQREATDPGITERAARSWPGRGRSSRGPHPPRGHRRRHAPSVARDRPSPSASRAGRRRAHRPPWRGRRRRGRRRGSRRGARPSGRRGPRRRHRRSSGTGRSPPDDGRSCR